jgi:hyperosmotically inducible protein
MKHCLAVMAFWGVLLGAVSPSQSEETKGSMEKFGAAVDEKMGQTREFLSDASVTASVKRRLFQDDLVPGKDVKVVVDNGVATLEGDMPSEEIAQRALEITRATEGIVKVNNRLSIIQRTPSKSK